MRGGGVVCKLSIALEELLPLRSLKVLILLGFSYQEGSIYHFDNPTLDGDFCYDLSLSHG